MRIALTIVAISLTGCATTRPLDQRILSVDEVRANPAQLDGKLIKVRGVLAGCERWPFVCHLDADDAQGGNSLAFDTSDDIRRKLKGDEGREVVIRATFDAFCFGPFAETTPEGDTTIRVCMDAATHLKNPEVLDIR